MKQKMINLLRCKTLLTLLILLMGCFQISLSQKVLPIASAEEVTLTSSRLNEDRIMSIYLPDSYHKGSQKYPVIYLLDGKTHFHHATGAISFLSNQRIIPEMIVVSIHNVDRNRDFSPVPDTRLPTSGGAENFLGFVSDELTNYIDKNYRTSGFNILMGHSFGGEFAVYALLQKPEVFDAYIAISPYLQYADNYIVEEAKKKLQSNYDPQKYFYMTIGDEPDYFPALSEFSDIIKDKTNGTIDFKYAKMPDENHASIPYISLFNSLGFIFSDWQLPPDSLKKGLSAVDAHYAHLANKYGVEIATPENVINFLGYTYLRNGDMENAIDVFTQNVKRYPKSANVYDSLGEAYETNNQLEEAEKNYQKAYDLGKKNNDVNILIFEKNLQRVQENK